MIKALLGSGLVFASGLILWASDVPAVNGRLGEQMPPNPETIYASKNRKFLVHLSVVMLTPELVGRKGQVFRWSKEKACYESQWTFGLTDISNLFGVFVDDSAKYVVIVNDVPLSSDRTIVVIQKVGGGVINLTGANLVGDVAGRLSAKPSDVAWIAGAKFDGESLGLDLTLNIPEESGQVGRKMFRVDLTSGEVNR